MLVLANTASAETPTHIRAADGEMLDVAKYQLASTDQFVRTLRVGGQDYVVVQRNDVDGVAYVIPIGVTG
jgi:hypothetical protein